MRFKIRHFYPLILFLLVFSTNGSAQEFVRELKINAGASIAIANNYGRITVESVPAGTKTDFSGKATVTSTSGVSDGEVRISNSGGSLTIEIVPTVARKRIDINLTIPERCRLKVQTSEGSIAVSGNIESLQAKTETGTIALDVPTDDLSYHFLWTQSRPRFVSDISLADVRELSAGRFSIKGHFGERRQPGKKKQTEANAGDDPDLVETASGDHVTAMPVSVLLDLTTARGIILLNVPANEVGSDLRERPLTEAAKAIVRSGDSLLMEAIRRAAPKYYGDYARSLPPYKREPGFTAKTVPENTGQAQIKTASVRVTDLRNRALPGLKATDFDVVESGAAREVISVEQATAPFNLVLLLDVSGSVENYVDFIRKAARSFVNTVDEKDRVSIIIFNDDIKVLSKFTTDKQKLSDSLDTFDAGGGTAYYDALAYVVADTLRPLKGERTAIVILTDGDDNRSFLAFDSLMGSIQESGSLIYPLYVPSGLIATEQSGKNSDIDPLRKKYMSLSAKSQGEGEKLARASGGVYYPISRIDQIQKAYEDIVLQLRTAYRVKFRSDIAGDGVQPRLKIKVKRENSFVTINSVTAEPMP